MNFKFNTEYNLTALTAMAKTLRKTVRKRKNTASRIFGCVVIVLALILIIPFGDERFVLNFNRIITLAAAIVILAVLLFEDKINAYFAKKRMIKGTDTAESIFKENEFISETELATSRWQYESIKIIAETNNYFVFVFDMNHAQVYDKKCLSEEKTNEFREFISEKTGLKILEIK